MVGSRSARDCGGFKTRLRDGASRTRFKTFGVLRADSTRNPLVLHVFLKNKRINYTRAGFVIRNGAGSYLLPRFAGAITWEHGMSDHSSFQGPAGRRADTWQ